MKDKTRLTDQQREIIERVLGTMLACSITVHSNMKAIAATVHEMVHDILELEPPDDEQRVQFDVSALGLDEAAFSDAFFLNLRRPLNTKVLLTVSEDASPETFEEIRKSANEYGLELIPVEGFDNRYYVSDARNDG